MRQILLAVGVSVVLGACASSQPQSHSAPPRPVLQIEQVKRGYQFCDTAECPAWAPKTIIVEPTPVSRAVQTRPAKKPAVVNRYSLPFRVASSVLNKSVKKVIAEVAKKCGKRCDVELFGYAEKSGSAAFKLKLATLRASIVEKEFLRLGIEKKSLHAGAAEGCCTKTPPKSLVVRRVEVIVTTEAE